MRKQLGGLPRSMVQLLSTTDLEGMLTEAAELASVHKNIVVVKIPCTAEGIKVHKGPLGKKHSHKLHAGLQRGTGRAGSQSRCQVRLALCREAGRIHTPYPPHHRLHGSRRPRSHLPAQAHPGPAGPSPHRKRPCQVCGRCREDDLIRSGVTNLDGTRS